MKKVSRLIALGLSFIMLLTLLAGCGSSQGSKEGDKAKENPGKEATQSPSAGDGAAGGADTSQPVELTMYLIGDRTPDFDEVYGKINDILKEKCNATLNVEFLSWSEHETKYSLLFSAKEEFDLIFTASSWCHYETTVSMGGFAEMTPEFIQTYAPDIWSVVPELAWEQAKIDGKIYMVPNYQNEFGQDVMAVRGDLMQKYGFKDITSWDEMMAFYKACAADGIYASQGGPWYQYFQSKGLTTVGGAPDTFFLFNTQNPSDTSVTYVAEWNAFRDYCIQMKELYEAGCWSSDALSSTAERQESFLNGTAAGMIWNLGTCNTYAKQANNEHPDWNCTIIDPVSSQPKKVNPYINNGVAININSKNKERAMMVLNEFYTNPAVYDLAYMGIEGKHWEAVGEDQYKVLDSSGYGISSNCNWGWNNMTIQRTEYIENRTALDDRYEALLDAWNANVKGGHVLDGFNFDQTNVTTQVAAVSALVAQYYTPLLNGMAGDVDAAIANLSSLMDKAGIQDIKAELERQIAEYVAGNK